MMQILADGLAIAHCPYCSRTFRGGVGVVLHWEEKHVCNEKDDASLDSADHDRIAGREWAEEILLDVEGGKYSEDFQEGFRRAMKRRFRESRNRSDVKPMTDGQAREFGKQVIEFGQHRGRRYDDVPLDYLEWLADRGVELHRYLLSRRIRGESK